MLTVFQVCFFVGVGLTIVAVIFGCLFDFIGIDGVDFNFHGADIMMPLSPIICILFTTVFGGIGIICLKAPRPMHTYLIFIVAVISGAVSSFLLNKFVIKPLKKAQNTSAANETELVGVIAKVTEKIYENGFGEIRYVIHDNSYTAPAKSVSGQQIDKGSTVVIYAIEDYIFYVSEYELNKI